MKLINKGLVMVTNSIEKTLKGADALAKVRQVIGDTKICFFCSDIKTGVPVSVRPMLLSDMDEQGNLWFLSKKGSEKEEEVKQDPFVHVLFQQGEGEQFLNIYGMSELQDDPDKIAELWAPPFEIWFKDAQDPAISLIKVSPLKGHYWDSVLGQAWVLGAFTPPSDEEKVDSIEGDLEF